MRTKLDEIVHEETGRPGFAFVWIDRRKHSTICGHPYDPKVTACLYPVGVGRVCGASWGGVPLHECKRHGSSACSCDRRKGEEKAKCSVCTHPVHEYDECKHMFRALPYDTRCKCAGPRTGEYKPPCPESWEPVPGDGWVRCIKPKNHSGAHAPSPSVMHGLYDSGLVYKGTPWMWTDRRKGERRKNLEAKAFVDYSSGIGTIKIWQMVRATPGWKQERRHYEDRRKV